MAGDGDRGGRPLTLSVRAGGAGGAGFLVAVDRPLGHDVGP